MESPAGMSDIDLMRASQAGSESARDELVDRFLPDVHRLCCFLLNDSGIAEDAAQETFLRVFRYLDRWDGRPPRPWLMTIAYNRCISQRQSRFRSSLDPFLDSAAQPDIQHDIVLGLELDAAIQDALAELRPEFRDVLVLHHVSSESVDEIARLMALPVGTVKTWLSRGRQALWNSLRAGGHVEGEMPRRPRLEGK
jgi:RNA polymerase sigma-70 factor (ECF subfamily)